MQNFDEMIDRLSRVSADLEAGSINVKEADAQANIAGKLTNNNKAKLEYMQAKKKFPDISNRFFDESKVRPLDKQTSKPKKLSQG